MVDLKLVRGRSWRLTQALDKLRLRNGLPGAHAFDRAAEALARATEAGSKGPDLLPLVFAASWFVNSAVPSPVFRKWLSPPLVDVWRELGNVLSETAWTTLDDGEKTTLLGALRALAIDGQGAGAISKALALLAPNAVPLMPDAAVAFALGVMPRPDAPDAQTASIDTFEPMMTWFAESVASAREPLEAWAGEHARTSHVVLSAAQVLDRLLWFDSVGYRYFRTKAGSWWAVVDGEREGVVYVAASFGGAAVPKEPVDLVGAHLPPAWAEEARAALHASS